MSERTKTYGDTGDWVDVLYNHPWTVRFIIFETLLVVSAFVIAQLGGPVPAVNKGAAVPQVISGILVVYAFLFAAFGLIAGLIYRGMKRYERRGFSGDTRDSGPGEAT